LPGTGPTPGRERGVGGPEVMRLQLDHLVAVTTCVEIDSLVGTVAVRDGKNPAAAHCCSPGRRSAASPTSSKPADTAPAEPLSAVPHRRL
jgi:hypothetical protein